MRTPKIPKMLCLFTHSLEKWSSIRLLGRMDGKSFPGREIERGAASSTFPLPFLTMHHLAQAKALFFPHSRLEHSQQRTFCLVCIFFFASLSSSWIFALLTLFFEMSFLLHGLSSFPMVDSPVHTHTHTHAHTHAHSLAHTVPFTQSFIQPRDSVGQ